MRYPLFPMTAIARRDFEKGALARLSTKVLDARGGLF